MTRKKDWGAFANPIVALIGAAGLALGIAGATAGGANTDEGQFLMDPTGSPARLTHAAAPPPLNIPPSPHDEEFRAAYNEWGNECHFLNPSRLGAQMHYDTAHQPTRMGFSPMTPPLWEEYGYEISEQGNRVGRPGGGDPGDINTAVAAEALYACKVVYDEMPLTLGNNEGGMWLLSLAGQLGGREAMFTYPRPQPLREYVSAVAWHQCEIDPKACRLDK